MGAGDRIGFEDHRLTHPTASEADPSGTLGSSTVARDGAGVILDSLAESVSGSKPPSYEDHSQYPRVRMAFRVA